MNAKREALNVLLGAAIGAAVPILATIALSFSVPEFHPGKYFLTICILCILSGAIGVAINLPRNATSATAMQRSTRSRKQQPGERANSQRFDSTAPIDETLRQQRQTKQDADTETKTSKNDNSQNNSNRNRQQSAKAKKRSQTAARRNSNMTYAQALRELELIDPGNNAAGMAAKTFSDDEIRKAYRKLALTYHPDRFSNANADQAIGQKEIDNASQRFKRINEAYNLLRHDG